MTPAEGEFIALSAAKLRANMDQIRKCLEQMDAQAVWSRPNAGSNSAANLCLHLAGNLGQLIGHAAGGQTDTRDRDGEFAATQGIEPGRIGKILSEAVENACAVIEAMPPGRLDETVEFRGRRWTVLELIYKAVEHFALHTGQIVYIAKSAGTIRLT
jgi:hypothetical protein